jgi:hypothetical protein
LKMQHIPFFEPRSSRPPPARPWCAPRQ